MDQEYYLTYAKLNSFQRRVAQSRLIIRESLKIPGIWAVSCSGGKDSIALLDICYKAGWRGPVFHFYYDETPTENTELVRELTTKYGLDFFDLKVPGAWDVFHEVGHFFVRPETPEEKRATNRMLRQYKEKVNNFVREQKWVGQFLGLRKTESRARSLMLAKKGAIYKTKDRTTWTACPLRMWKSEDVWAYILSHDLPYLSCYKVAEDPDRERSETTWLAAESIWRHGMAARIKRERPEEFRRLAAKYPQIRMYT